jgi:hypothetical protein
MAEPYAVALARDPSFRERLGNLTLQVPVRISDSPVDRAVAERHSHEHTDRTHTEGVTTFKRPSHDTPEQACASIL